MEMKKSDREYYRNYYRKYPERALVGHYLNLKSLNAEVAKICLEVIYEKGLDKELRLLEKGKSDGSEL